MILSACSDPIGPGLYVDSTCSESQVVGRRANGSTGSVWRGAGVRTVHVVHGLWLASSLASYLLTPACVGTPVGNAGSGNPICKRAGCSSTCSTCGDLKCNLNALVSCGC